MGGNVGFIIRQENGEQLGMSRWTNIMPHFFRDANLYTNNSKQWLDEFLKEWLKMKEDYEANKETKKYKFNMTSVYFPHNTLSPDEYGIVVVDFKNKKIYSSQDYCTIGKFNFYSVWSSFDSEEEKTQRFKTYFDNKLIKEMSIYDTKTDQEKIVDLNEFTCEDVICMMQELCDKQLKNFSHPLLKIINKKNIDDYYSHFIINSDWKFSVYHDRSLGVLKIRKELEEDGFVFNEKDDIAWKEYLSWNWGGYDEKDIQEDEHCKSFMNLYKEIFKEDFVFKKN